MNESLILILHIEKFSCMSNSINSLYSQGSLRLRFVYQTQPQRLLDNTRTAYMASWRKKPDTDKTQKDTANLLGGFYCRTSLHHSFTPLSALSQPHLQQTFPGNLSAKSARETSRRTKQVDELQISLSLLVQSPSLMPRSAVVYQLLTSSLFASIARRLNRSQRNTLLLFLLWTPSPFPKHIQMLALAFRSQCLETA